MARTRLGAAHDDPTVLIDRAIATADRYHGHDSFKLRRAAEIGWLAASSAVDVAAKRMGRSQPKGYNTRHGILDTLEARAKLRRGSLTGQFHGARGTLHGDCFHDDVCPPRIIKSALVAVKTFTEDVDSAVDRLRGRRG
jgi:hypothetical protein